MTKKNEKNEEKRPLDMTTDEAMEYLFGLEGAQELKRAVHGMTPPQGDGTDGSEMNGESTHTHTTT